MKTSSRSRKLLFGALAFAAVGYGIRHHRGAVEARQPEAVRASGVWVDLLAFRIVPAWFVAHPGGSCQEAVAALASENRRDGWGRPYRLTCEGREHGHGQRVLVRSAGPDGSFGTDDDIYSYALNAWPHA